MTESPQNPSGNTHDIQSQQSLAEHFKRKGEPLLLYDVTVEGLEHHKGDVRLRQLQAHALHKSGAVQKAIAILGALDREGHGNEETMGLLGSAHKSLGLMTGEAEQRTGHLAKAFACYQHAYAQEPEHYWTGINAAALALINGDRGQASETAEKVYGHCQQILAKGLVDEGHRYWLPATLGEAALMLGRFQEAENWYAQAVAEAGTDYGYLSATRHQALLLTNYMECDQEAIKRWLPLPTVVVFTGHMIDAPNRQVPRFPPEQEPEIQRAIDEVLREKGTVIGYASAACGSDILFLEAIRKQGGVTHIVLPYEQEAFAGDSVGIIPGAGWTARFKEVLAGAATVTTVSPQKLVQGGLSYDYANQVLLGLAEINAKHLDTDLAGLAVWDGSPGDGPGGTASIAELWSDLKLQWTRIDPASSRIETPAQTVPCTDTVSSEGGEQDGTRIVSMLFADVKGFSKLTEGQLPLFVEHLMGAVGALCGQSSHKPVYRNTWGDGLFFVFETIRDTGLFALELNGKINSTNWADLQLPEDLNMRIALHAGPVYTFINPITGVADYAGAHISRAARIEPVTIPGEVWASQAFAALSRVAKVTEFTCDYVGQKELAKGYGTFPLYHVHK